MCNMWLQSSLRKEGIGSSGTEVIRPLWAVMWLLIHLSGQFSMLLSEIFSFGFMTMHFWTVHNIQEITQCLPTDDYLTISKLLDIVNNTIYNSFHFIISCSWYSRNTIARSKLT